MEVRLEVQDRMVEMEAMAAMEVMTGTEEDLVATAIEMAKVRSRQMGMWDKLSGELQK
jgi:hypothetical protein